MLSSASSWRTKTLRRLMALSSISDCRPISSRTKTADSDLMPAVRLTCGLIRPQGNPRQNFCKRLQQTKLSACCATTAKNATRNVSRNGLLTGVDGDKFGRLTSWSNLLLTPFRERPDAQEKHKNTRQRGYFKRCASMSTRNSINLCGHFKQCSTTPCDLVDDLSY